METKLDTILNKTDELQKEMHTFIDEITRIDSNRVASYQDLVTTFFLFKIAELKEEIKEMKTGLTMNIN